LKRQNDVFQTPVQLKQFLFQRSSWWISKSFILNDDSETDTWPLQPICPHCPRIGEILLSLNAPHSLARIIAFSEPLH
jgi:hypothetical protein